MALKRANGIEGEGGRSWVTSKEDKTRCSFMLGDLERGTLPAKALQDLEKACPPLFPENKKPIR